MERVGGCLRGKGPGTQKGKTVQEVTARAYRWRSDSVGSLREQVSFLEEVRWVKWHKGKVRGRCGKRKEAPEKPRGKGWVHCA